MEKETLNNSPIVSVIIPVYNVEEYLRECVNSVTGQTYNNLEIILSDDGATDSSGQICDELAAADSRIRVIHEVNGGLSVARNRGLDIATGDYIIFVDSDDTVDTRIIEILLKIINDYDADIVITRHPKNPHGQFINLDNPTDVVTYTTEEAIKLFLERKLTASAWGKLYRRDLIGDSRFVPRLFNEDAVFSADIFPKAKRVAYTDQVLYNYRTNESSLTNNFSPKHFDIFSNAKVIDEKIAALPYDTTVERRHYRTEMAMDCALAIYKNNMTKLYHRELRTFQKALRKGFWKNLFCAKLTMRQKAKFLLANFIK